MMRTIGKQFLVLAVLVVSCGLSASATTILFDEGLLANGTNITNQWVSFGLTFAVSNGTLQIGTSPSPWPAPPAGSDIASRFAVVLSSGGTANATILFHAPGDPTIPGFVDGSTISLSLWDTEATPSPRVTVNAYDLSNALLGSINLTALYGNALGGLTGNVHKLVIVDNGADGHVFDNLTFGDITQVPEPGTFALLGAGLLGVGLALRRRRA